MAKRSEVLFGMLGGSTTRGNEEDEGVELDDLGTRMVEHGECVSVMIIPNLVLAQPYKPFYTAEEVRAFRSLGLEPGMIPTPAPPILLTFPKGYSSLGLKITQSYYLKTTSNIQPSFTQMRM